MKDLADLEQLFNVETKGMSVVIKEQNVAYACRLLETEIS